MKKIVAALLVSAAFSAPAFAVGFTDGVVGTKYVAADLGSISYGGNSATSISVGGGYQVHPAVAVEVDYLMGGKYSYGGGVDTSLTALQVQAVGHYTVNSDFSAYAKAGIAHNTFKVGVAPIVFGPFVLVPGGTMTTTSNDLTFAIGAKYNFTKDIAGRVQYQETGVSSVNVLSVGATFNF